MSAEQFDLYEYPPGYQGRKRYVTVPGRGVVAACYTYHDGSSYRVLPEYGGEPPQDNSTGCGVFVMKDIGEYTSTVDGTRITTRSQHRDHLRRHDMIEVGNERVRTQTQEMSRAERGNDIRRAMAQLSERG